MKEVEEPDVKGRQKMEEEVEKDQGNELAGRKERGKIERSGIPRRQVSVQVSISLKS